VLAFVLDQTLRLLHPFVPFITEGIFQNLNAIAPKRGLKGIMELTTAESIMIAPWPQRLDEKIDEKTEADIQLVQDVIRAIREVRSQYNIAPSKKMPCSATASESMCQRLSCSANLIAQLAGAEPFEVGQELDKPENAAAAVVGEVQIFVHDVIDPDEERKRLQKQKEFIEKGIQPLTGKLGNGNFVSRAKPEVVEQTRQKRKELQDQLTAVEKLLAELE
jgi:valyl-tRNA synthetase